jgi:hypothetical protein
MSSCLGFGRKRDDDQQPLLPQVSYHASATRYMG